MMMNKIKKITLLDLRSCYLDEGTLASQINFTDYWARDTFWTIIGMLESLDASLEENDNDFSQIRKSFELFAKYQRFDGKIPRKIVLDYNCIKYLFKTEIKRKVPRPIYTSPIKLFFSFDDNLLFVIAFCRYIEKTRDFELAKKYFPNVKKALEFYCQNNLVKKTLLCEIGLGNWQDTIFKKGFVLYTNCLWLEATRGFEKLTQPIENQASSFLLSSSEIKARIQELFWLEEKGYFADSVSPSGKKQEFFDLAGNVLAIIFNITDKQQSETIFQKIKEIQQEGTGVPSCARSLHPINHPRYPFWKISPVNFLLNIQDYQNGISWSWVEALLIIAYLKQNKKTEASVAFENLSKIVIGNGHLHETYFLDGRPFDHLLWKSAVPFAWGAGLLLWAIDEYEKLH